LSCPLTAGRSKSFARRPVTRNQKALDDAKLTGVVSDILGESGRVILDALVAGETDPEKLAELTKGRLKAPRQTLLEALRGHVRAHHRFVIKAAARTSRRSQPGRARLQARLEE
jgi:transposase